MFARANECRAVVYTIKYNWFHVEYYLFGRLQHEVVSISEKVVLKVSDLMTWMVDDVKWDVGARGVYEDQCRPADESHDAILAAAATAAAAVTSSSPAVDVGDPTAAAAAAAAAASAGANEWHGPLDMRDIIKEKQLLSKSPSYRFVLGAPSVPSGRCRPLGARSTPRLYFNLLKHGVINRSSISKVVYTVM